MQKLRSSAVGRLHRLGSARRRLLLKATFVLSAASAAVALLPFRTAIRFGCVRARGGNVRVEDCVWAVEAAARRLPWRTMCIEQSLAVQRILRGGGVDARLHYGARHDPLSGQLQAHVWVTVAGRSVIGGDVAADFAEVACYPAGGE